MCLSAATRRLCAVAVFLAVAGCGVPDQSRWQRGEVSAISGEPDVASDATGVAIIEVGPVVAAIEARGVVLVVDPTVVLADRTGRLERRTTAAGDAIASHRSAAASRVPPGDVVALNQARPRVAAASSSRTNQLATAAGNITRPIARKPHW